MIVRPAEPGDAAAFAARLRAADLVEVQAASGESPEAAISLGIAKSNFCNVGLYRGEPVVIFGVGSLPGAAPYVGAPWLLGTPLMEAAKLPFLRHSRPWVDKMQTLYPLLVNWTHADNTLHHRWLRWCGFTLLARRVIRGSPFIEFIRFQTRV